MVAEFSTGDLVVIVCPETTGFTEGEVGLVISVERMNYNHFIYWGLFGKEKKEVPMWGIEIKKLA